MERFLKFKEEIDLIELQNSLSDPRVIVLRKSQATDTIQVRVPDGMSHSQIKQVFGPYEVKKVYNEFPYPISGDGFSKYFTRPVTKLINRHA